MKGYLKMKDVKKLIVIQSVIDKKRTGQEASQALGLSERQIWRLVKEVKEKGNEGIIHKNTFNNNHKKFNDDIINKIIELKKSYNYELTNFNHFRDLLEEKENINISYSSLYRILKNNGFISKNKHKDRKIHRRRKRKSYEGDLVQTDGTPYDWFEDGNMYSIHGFIDDATGKILGLYMTKHECLLGYLEALRSMLKNHGIPKVIYPDKYSVFFPTRKQKLTIEEELEGKKQPTTQFMNIITTLGIQMYPASTSQAKGRIERLWKTLQDRLVSEFRINNIKTIEEANKFFKIFIPSYNKKFSVKAECEEIHFTKVPPYIDLNLLLSIKLTRMIDNGGCFTIQNNKFQILNNNILPRVKVEVYINKKEGIFVLHNGIKYKVVCEEKLPSSYSTHTMNELYQNSMENNVEIANNLLTYDSKVNEPILTSY